MLTLLVRTDYWMILTLNITYYMQVFKLRFSIKVIGRSKRLI